MDIWALLGAPAVIHTDNGTEFGARYGMGPQPFGNPNLSYGSQAPLHMGFYHLDWLTAYAQPELKRGLPLWRIVLYESLAELAFTTGHDYWGWRLMGWALHYIGDLSQPYHAEPLPGVSLLSALWSVIIGRTGEVIQLVSNRHGEGYTVTPGLVNPDDSSAVPGQESAARVISNPDANAFILQDRTTNTYQGGRVGRGVPLNQGFDLGHLTQLNRD